MLGQHPKPSHSPHILVPALSTLNQGLGPMDICLDPPRGVFPLLLTWRPPDTLLQWSSCRRRWRCRPMSSRHNIASPSRSQGMWWCCTRAHGAGQAGPHRCAHRAGLPHNWLAEQWTVWVHSWPLTGQSPCAHVVLARLSQLHAATRGWPAQVCADAGLGPVFVYQQGTYGWRLDDSVHPYRAYHQVTEAGG